MSRWKTPQPLRNKFFQLRVEAEFLRRIDDARRLDPELPSRTDLVRRILDAWLDETLGQKQKPRLRAVSK